jgi:hypothetical protein
MRSDNQAHVSRPIRLVIAAVTFFVVVMLIELVVSATTGEAVNWTAKAMLWGISAVVVSVLYEWFLSKSVKVRRNERDSA